MTHFSQLLSRWAYPVMKRLLSILVLVSILFAAVAPAYAEGPRGGKSHETAGARSNPDDNGAGPERNDNDPGAVDADDVDSKPNGKNDNGTGNESDGDCDDNEGNCKAHQPKDGEATGDPASRVTSMSGIAVSSGMTPNAATMPTPLVTPVSEIVVSSETARDTTSGARSTNQDRGVATSTPVPPVIVTVVVTETVVVTDVHTVTETVVADTGEPQVGGRMLAAPFTSNCPTCCEVRTPCCSQSNDTNANTNWLAAVIIFAGLVINGLLRRGRPS